MTPLGSTDVAFMGSIFLIQPYILDHYGRQPAAAKPACKYVDICRTFFVGCCERSSSFLRRTFATFS